MGAAAPSLEFESPGIDPAWKQGHISEVWVDGRQLTREEIDQALVRGRTSTLTPWSDNDTFSPSIQYSVHETP